ncbi:hypothetical protein Tco_1180357 [Tanacetum coccineum]
MPVGSIEPSQPLLSTVSFIINRIGCCNHNSTFRFIISDFIEGFNPSSLFFYFLNDVYVHDACLIIIRSWRDCQDLWKSASVSTCGIRAKGIKQHNNSCSSIIQRIKTCVLKKTRTWMPIEEDVELKRKRTPHRDKLLRRERKADEKRTIRVTTIERETFREDHNIGGSRQRFEMPFKVTGLSNDGQSLGSEISANLHMRARRNLPRSHYGNQEEVTGRTLEICNQHSTHSIYISELLGFNPSSLFFYFLNDVYVHDACLIIIRSWRDCQDLWKSASVSTCGIRAKGIKQHNNSCSSIIQRIKTCVLKKTRTWMPIEEDVELKRKRTPHRDKLLRRERKADEKRTIRVTTIERETFREDHNIGGSRQRFEMPFKVTGLSNDGQSLGSEISANLHMRARRNLPRSHYGNQEEVTGRTLV